MKYKIELTQVEINALVSLIDAGVRHGGVRVAKDAAVLMIKIEEATKQNAPEEPAEAA